MRSDWLESREGLQRAGCLSAFEPFVGTPSAQAVVVQMPPGVAISDLGPTDHSKHCAIFQHLDGLVPETGTGAEPKPPPFGVSHPNVASNRETRSRGLTRGTGLAGSTGFDRNEQRGIQTSGAEVLFPDRAQLSTGPRWGIHMPFYAGTLEVLSYHARLKGEFAYRESQHVRATMVKEEIQEAEANVVASLCVVAAELAANQRLGHRRRTRRPVAEKLSKRAQLHLAPTLCRRHTLHARATEILDRMAVLVEGFRNRRSPGLKSALGFASGEEGFAEVVPCLREVLCWAFLRLTRMSCHEQKDGNQTADGGPNSFLQYRYSPVTTYG